MKPSLLWIYLVSFFELSWWLPKIGLSPNHPYFGKMFHIRSIHFGVPPFWETSIFMECFIGERDSPQPPGPPGDLSPSSGAVAGWCFPSNKRSTCLRGGCGRKPRWRSPLCARLNIEKNMEDHRGKPQMIYK